MHGPLARRGAQVFVAVSQKRPAPQAARSGPKQGTPSTRLARQTPCTQVRSPLQKGRSRQVSPGLLGRTRQLCCSQTFETSPVATQIPEGGHWYESLQGAPS